jgi:hypothetical protein
MVVVGVELALQLRNLRKMLRRFLRRLLLLCMLSVEGGVHSSSFTVEPGSTRKRSAGSWGHSGEKSTGP